MNLDPTQVAGALLACDEMERHTRSMLAEYPGMPAEARDEMLTYLKKLDHDRTQLKSGLQ